LENYFQRNKHFLLFLGKFFLTYLLLTVLYQLYLNSFEGVKLDPITKIVANQTEWVLKIADGSSFTEDDPSNQFVRLFYKNVYIGRIIEGCNAMSVIILFVSFVVAFSGRAKQTLLFLLAGSLIIYILNIFRIAVLVMLLYLYPAQEHLLHGVLFPLVIYGIVFILWVIWVNNFSKYASRNTK
jgi:exosortase family protein XrtF